jgi:murein DD-endopeptidase MepM/ murein hydrolase activator NlpD
MRPWLATARTILATAAVTSAAWLIGGSIYIQHERATWALPGKPPPRPVAAQGRAPAVHAGGEAPAVSGKLLIPVTGVAPGALVDTFAQARAGGARIHDAIDIMAPRGAPVVAAAPGTVEKLFLSRDGGNTIYVRSPDRTTMYYYAHLDSYAPGLAEDQQVRAGQPLGTVGSTGNANPAAPHLHFAIIRMPADAKWWGNGMAVNPFPLLTGG